MNSTTICLDNTLHILSKIAENEIASAFDHYFENYEKTTSKAKIEWELIKAILHLKELQQLPQLPQYWHDGLKQRTSGVALLFICSQFAKIEIEFFPELNKLIYVPSNFKRHLAYSWECNSQCKCLDNHNFRKSFALWLAQANKAIGACLLAESARNDLIPELIDELCSKWIQKGLSDSNTPKYLSKAVKIPILKDVSIRAVKKCVGFFFGNKESLCTLIQSAFDLEEYETVVAYSEMILTPDIDDDMRRNTLSRRLTALSELDREQEVIEEYRSLWAPENWDFPFPDRLLFIFQLYGQNDLENHLLKNCVINEYSPSWFKLTWQYLNNGKSEDLLKKWSDLYIQDSQDLKILFGFTKLLVSLPEISRTEWIEKIKKHWEDLYEYEDPHSIEKNKPYDELAGAFLVLINKVKVELIEAFQKYLSNKRLNHPMSKLAAQAYIRALSDSKQWKELRDYLDGQDIHFIRAVSPFEEDEFIRTMANLENLPNDEAHLIIWCQYWERLISLPIDSEMILQAVDHFVNLREKLIAENHISINDYLFEDIRLQILRRAKAEAEKLLMNILLPDEDKKKISADLQKAGLDGTHGILRELIVHL